MNIEQLVASEAICTTKARYCRFIDLKQWDDLRQLFVPDARLTFRGIDGQVLYQFDDLRAFIETTANALLDAQTIYQVHNPEITLTSPTTATAIWSMEDHVLSSSNQDGPFNTLHGYGDYYETFQRTDGTWRIKTIDLRRTISNIT